MRALALAALPFVLALALLASLAEAPAAPAPTPEAIVLAEIAPPLPRGELACLAQTAYHEARGEGAEGMAAVIHVVLNRTQAVAWPDTPCEVAMQGAEASRSGRCQFSWACDGQADTPRDLSSYTQALILARDAAMGRLPDPTGGAVMFHAERVTPAWTEAAEPTAAIGAHVFYRLDG